MNIEDLDDDAIFSLRVSLEVEMRKRGIKFAVGELGESFAIKFFNEKKGLPTLLDAPVGTKNVDAISREGDRYSIKTVQRGGKTGTVYPDHENPQKQLFEYMLIARIDETYSLKSLYRLTWDDFVRVRAWDKRMSAWYVPVNGSRLAQIEQLIETSVKMPSRVLDNVPG